MKWLTGIEMAFPIPDRQVPASEREVTEIVDQLELRLAGGGNMALHCRQGIGKTGLIAAGLLLAKGFDSEAAVQLLSGARGIPVPETLEQRRSRRGPMEQCWMATTAFLF